MPSRDLLLAWVMLAALSAATTLTTLYRADTGSRTAIAAAVLVLAGLKARVILSRYLGLAASHFWSRTFDLAIGGFLAIAFAIYLAGSGT